MKVFLSWSPVPPDPHFWKWIPLDGIVVSTALLKQEGLLKRAVLVGLHEFLDFRGPIFLDSGSYEDFIADKKLRPNSPIELLTLAKWLGADFVAHLDIPFIGKNASLPEEEKWALLRRNMLNAHISCEWSNGNKSKTKVIYVIQGWNKESLAYCCEDLVKLDVDYYAIGSLKGLQANEIEARVRLVRKILGNKPRLHLFAVSDSSVLKRVQSLVDSVDSSTASIAGAMKEIIKPSGGRNHIDSPRRTPECNCPVCQKHKGAILLLGKRGTQNHYNQLRKIHNAYQLLLNIRKAIKSEPGVCAK